MKDQNIIPTFREVFLPLELHYSKVFANGHMAIDFALGYSNPQAFVLSEESQQRMVDALNGEDVTPNIKTHYTLTAEGCFIYMITSDGVKHLIMTVRGWGYLIGVGGLHLSVENASRIQNDFVEYIVNILNSYIKKVNIKNH